MNIIKTVLFSLLTKSLLNYHEKDHNSVNKYISKQKTKNFHGYLSCKNTQKLKKTKKLNFILTNVMNVLHLNTIFKIMTSFYLISFIILMMI